MNRLYTMRIPVILLFALFLFLGCGARQQVPRATGGVMDISGWNFQEDGILTLSGQWEFYRGRLLSPNDFTGPVPPEKTGFISMPSFRTVTSDGSRYLGGDAHGTLRLRVTLPPIQTPLTLAVRGPKSAYRLWVDALLAAEDGKVGEGKASETPGKRSISFVTLVPPQAGKTVELVLQLSSYHGDPVGAVEALRLGPESRMTAWWDHARGFLICSVSILLIMGCYHLSLFAYRPAEPSPLYFGIFCLMWMTHFAAFSINRWLIYTLLPGLGYMAVDRLEMLAYFFSIPFILYFYRALFPDETPVLLPRLYLFAACGLALCLLAGLWHRIAGPVAAHAVSGFAIALSMVILTRALLRRWSSAALIFSGGVILNFCAVNDILNDLGLIDTGNFMRLGLLVFILCQSWALARRFSKAFATSEALFAEVTEKNIALSKLDKLKDEFLTNTSHELRTPLNGIIGIGESLMAGAAGKLDDKVRSNLSMVVHSGRRLARLVNEILDFSRLKNSDVALVKKPVDLAASAAAVTSILEKTMSGREVVLETRMPEHLPPVLGDEDRIQQILYNLLGNAVKFTERGRITLSAAVTGEMLSVSVADTGSGIPEEKLERIFEPFEQADAPAAGVGGTGLGLAITRKLVRLHGGRIRVDAAPGRGAVFTFTLPLAGPDARPERPATDVGPPDPSDRVPLLSPPSPLPLQLPPADGGHVTLVVDDDPINLRVAANHLAVAGHGVRTASGGAEALEIIRSEEPPDLVLLDIIMPGMSGHAVCREIRADHAPQRLPVVMLTAAGRPSDLVEGFAAGANDYLVKPFSGQELIARVDAQLRLKEAFRIMAENVRLRRRLAKRKETVQYLLLTQRRLSELLDTVADAVLAVNEDHEIAFSNRACRELLGFGTRALLGSPLRTVATPETAEKLATALADSDAAGSAPLPGTVFMKSDNTPVVAEVLITSLDLDGDPLNVLLIRTPAAAPPAHAALPLIAELNRNQQRLQTLEASLSAALPQAPRIREELKAVDSALAAMQQALLPPEERMDKSILAVSVMNLCVDCWVESTGMNKFDLARQSGLWKVYTNLDGWERAQTLDKYFDTATLPKNPRWRRVIATAEFVLTFCEPPSGLRDRLEAVLADLRRACR